MMMVPRRKNEFDLFEEMFNDPFFTKTESKMMKTDIKEKEGNYLLEIDLPGYEKENIKIEIEDGFLTVNASIDKTTDSSDSRYVHKERYVGECSRSFYVGEEVSEEDIKASFKNGTLKLEIPKKEEKKLNNKKYIEIE